MEMAIFFVVALVVCIAYVFVIVLFATGWMRTEEFTMTASCTGRTRCSILIAARNESNSIGECLRSIMEQDHPKVLYEVIVADDGSEDNTSDIVKSFMQRDPSFNLQYVKVNGDGGKKQALMHAAAKANGELILTTDADTTRGKQWLSSLVSFYETQQPKMIIGPVCYTNERSLFEKIQSLEFMALAVTGAGGAELGMPVMCNGANLAFQRKAFEQAGGYAAIDRSASGDDVMLMTKIHAMFPGEVKFMRSRQAMTFTNACATPREFLHQRVRWASKNRSLYNITSFVTGSIIFLMHFVLLAGIILALFFPALAVPMLILFGAKCFIDFLFLFLAAAFFKKLSQLLVFVPAQLFNILYINVVAIMAVPGRYDWKGRRQR